MIELADIARICGVPEAEVVRVARAVKAAYGKIEGAMAKVFTLDFTEATALVTALCGTGANPLRLLELGTQFGVSTCLLMDSLKALGIRPLITTYDVDVQRHLFKEGEADFRQEDITARCGAVLDELKPHAVFLDAHPWRLTYNMTLEIRRRRILFFMHDVADTLWNENLQGGRLPIEGNECNPNAPWERKVLEVVFGPGIHSGHLDAGDYRIDLVRSHLGLAIGRPTPAAPPAS
ncbi:MAG: hypothetical protein HY343_04760 [Lentisphaerae bacterium]|nr:hypothetical protein [Lentisphaerota bacterium]